VAFRITYIMPVLDAGVQLWETRKTSAYTVAFS